MSRLSRLALGLIFLGAAASAYADARICTSSDAIDFGNRQVGSIASGNVIVTNCGDQTWSFVDVTVHPSTGPAFHVNTSCAKGLSLAPGDSCNVGVTFAPQIPGQTSGGLQLRSMTTTPDELLAFYGRGIDAQAGTAELVFSPAIAAFPPQSVGTRSVTAMDLELHNQGPAALTLTAIVLNGPAAHDFVGFDSGCQVGLVIPAGQGCHMIFYFQPQGAGLRLANLVIDSPQLASLAILQISGTGTTLPASTATVVEFYSSSLDHYFISSLQPDIDALDSGHFKGWVRTGRSFNAYARQTAGANPVCRFYMPAPQDSHFYSASPDECAAVAAKFPQFMLEASDVFYIPLPDPITGACPASTIPVYRLFNNRADANHRYTADPGIKTQMQQQGYTAEGYGPDAVIMCAPAS